jgi:histidinol-phosphate aminotransferase
MKRTPADVIRPEIRALSPYHVPDANGLIKLDAMENPFGFPADLRDGLARELASVALNRYPAPDAGRLKRDIRHAMQVPANLDILLGNGSDEIIQIIAMAVARPGASLLSMEPSFVMFRMIATFCGLRYVGIPLRADFSLDIAAVLEAMAREHPAVTFIAYPNNPTGNLFDRAALLEIIAAAGRYGGLVVIDEAYFAFSPASMLGDIAGHPNAVLMRTLSKLGLAGIRLGMLFGQGEWLAEFDKLRLPYNINALTQAAAGFALRHYDALLRQAGALKAERARLAAALATIERVQCFPSEANFILIRVADANRTFAHLLSRKILVKNTSSTHAMLVRTLRITIGTPAENDALIAAFQDSIGT